jgi:hypothetical protein
MDHQVAGIDAGDRGEGYEPTERVEVEPGVFVDDAGEGPSSLYTLVRFTNYARRPVVTVRIRGHIAPYPRRRTA